MKTEFTNVKVSVKHRKYVYQGKTISEWAKVLGCKPKTIQNRLTMGWTLERAVTTPYNENRRGSRSKKYFTITLDINEMSYLSKRHNTTIFNLLKKGWTPKEVLLLPPHSQVVSRKGKLVNELASLGIVA